MDGTVRAYAAFINWYKFDINFGVLKIARTGFQYIPEVINRH